MLNDEYERLVHYIEGMIDDGVQLVHGGNIIDWKDTNVSDVLKRIKKMKKNKKAHDFKSGQLVKNMHTGQSAAIINADDKFVYLVPSQKTITYPIELFWNHHEKKESG